MAAFLAPQPGQAYTVARDGTLIVWGEEDSDSREPREAKVGMKRLRDKVREHGLVSATADISECPSSSHWSSMSSS